MLKINPSNKSRFKKNALISNILGLFLSIIFLQGCANKLMILRSGKTEELERAYSRGNEVLISSKKNLVTLTPFQNIYRSNKSMMFYISVTNLAQESVNVGNENIFILTLQDDIRSRVLSLEEIEARISNDSSNAIIANSMIGALDIYNTTRYSGYSYATTQFNNSGTKVNTTFYDPKKVRDNVDKINNSTNYRNNQIIEKESQQLLLASNLYFRKQTVSPGQTYSGYIEIRKEISKNYNSDFAILVIVGEEKHYFPFSEKTVENPNVSLITENIPNKWWVTKEYKKVNYDELIYCVFRYPHSNQTGECSEFKY